LRCKKIKRVSILSIIKDFPYFHISNELLNRVDDMGAPNYRLLIISDAVSNNRTDRNYFRSTNCIYDLSIVTSIAEGLHLCRTSSIDAVLLGGDLSDTDGLIFLESLAAQDGISRPTVIMVAIEGDPRIAVRAMKLGAQDYLLERDLTPELLQSTIGSGIEKARLQLQEQEGNDRFRVAIDDVLESIAVFSAVRDEAGQIIDFRFDYLNPSALADNQMTAADIHRTFCEIFPAVRETGLFDKYCHVVETGEPLVQDNWIYSDTFGTQYLTKVYDLRVVKCDDGVVATWRDITDRKRIELAFQESEERLRLTIEAAELGTIDFNLLTGEIVWNATAEVFMGYEPGAAETYTYADFEARIHPDDRARVNADLVWVTIDRSDSNSEYRVILPDGTVRWMRGFGRFYDDAEGRAVRMLGTIEDITDAKCAEIRRQRAEDSLQQLSDELERQLQRFNVVASSVPDFIYTFDLLGRFTYANQPLLDLWKRSLDSIIGKDFYDLDYPTELADRHHAQIQQVIDTKQPIKDETPYTSFLGTRSYEYIFVPLFSKDCAVEAVAGITRDITDRKQSELALKASEERYKALIDITAQIVWNTESNGKILHSNVVPFIGENPEESEGGGWMWAIHPDDQQRTSELWSLAIANQTPFEIEHRVRRWDGEYRLMSGRAIPLFNDDGSLREWVGLHTDVTEIRKDEANLRRSEEFNRRILENNQDCIKVIDLDGRLLYMNDSGKKMLGIADFTQYDRSLWTNFWGGSEQNLAQSALDSAIAGTIGSFEGQCPTVTGIPKWWEVNVIPLHDNDGNVDQILLISHDLTDRRQAEDELRLSRALAQYQLLEIEAIYQTAPIGLAVLDVNLCFQRVNQTLAEMNGMTMADHIGRTVREVIPHLANGNESLLRHVLQTGKPLLNLELSGETSAQPGTYRTWIANYYPLTDGDGQSFSINVVVQEITDRKISEAILKESEERFRNTFEQAAVGIAHVALDGRWLLVNPKLCEIFGYTKAELLYGYFQDITHPDDIAQDQESIRQILADEIQVIELDKRYIHKLGQIVWVNLKGMLRRDSSGSPLYFIASIEDITYRKHAEISLQTQADQLIETTAMVELRNQELNRFSYVVSHDLKAPLRGISNLATWISDDLPSTIDPDILANLELMRSRVARMGDLVDDLLEYARVGSTTANLETFSVEQLLADIVDLLSIPDSFAVKLPAELPPIRTNRVLLSQVLTNLIGNAYKHHDRSDGKIQVLVQPDVKIWEFSVIDDGRGIAPEHQEKVFEIFKTVSGIDKNNSGIGLSIVKKIVETQGGQIKLESAIGMGTTFYFTWILEI
jgi:PAS domain S-box-containing protein